MIVHSALTKMTPAAKAKVAAIVTFGDPDQILGFGAMATKAHIYCKSSDPVCGLKGTAGTGNGGSHLGYGAETGPAAAFIKSKLAA
jgi:cutinase